MPESSREVQLAQAVALRLPALDYALFHDPLPVHHFPIQAVRPLTILPVLVPESAHREARALCPLWNQLIDAAARDTEWLHRSLGAAATADDFTKRLVEVSKAVHEEPGGIRQPLYFAVHRSDYMLHQEPEKESGTRLLNVEVNVISPGGMLGGQMMTNMHRFLLGRYAYGDSGLARSLQAHYGLSSASSLESLRADLEERLPENCTPERVTQAFALAHSSYCAGCESGGERPPKVARQVAAANRSATPSVLIAIEEGDLSDEGWLEYRLWAEHKIPVIRRTLGEIYREGSLDAETGKLRIGEDEISVVYFRVGFNPEDYPSQNEWDARKLLERSLAVKCPSVAYQLVGSKKMQQALAQPGVVERFLKAGDAARLRGCFTGLWGLGTGEQDASVVEKALAAPQNYVLKPQREGGGNNFFGEELTKKLQELSENERGAYILMQRILSPSQEAVIVRNHTDLTAGRTISEFGFFSVFLGAPGSQPQVNEHIGYNCRTKVDGTDEGGVTRGYAAPSSAFMLRK